MQEALFVTIGKGLRMQSNLRSALIAYTDHQQLIHVGPGVCPKAESMGAAFTVAQTLVLLAKGRKLCDRCAATLEGKLSERNQLVR